MSLYCLKHKRWAYRNHPCPINSLIPLKKECRGIADRLYSLGLDIMSAAYFTYTRENSIYEHSIIIDIEFQREYQYPITILGDLPTGWKFYTETVTEDHIPLLVLGYSETFVWSGVQTVDERVMQIIKDFEAHLDTSYDPKAVKAILMLMDS